MYNAGVRTPNFKLLELRVFLWKAAGLGFSQVGLVACLYGRMVAPKVVVIHESYPSRSFRL
jgi:hypothetical protein